MSANEVYMRRCFDLAAMGAQTASPNPMVGSALVHEDKVIGEGYHYAPGSPHAEVMALRSVPSHLTDCIPASTMYVSLEPCCHIGRTPPCTDLILAHGIKKVIISCHDPNPKVSGKGVEKLRAHGVEVTEGVLKQQGLHLLRFFTSSMSAGRPYIILKMAQSKDGFMGVPERQVWLSNQYEQMLVHKMRSHIDAILVGTNTALTDNPKLTNRNYSGGSPLRCVMDRTGRIPKGTYLLDGSAHTLIYTANSDKRSFENVEYMHIDFSRCLEEVLEDLHSRHVQSLLVEGGASLVQSFVQEKLWDEAWIATSQRILGHGIRAPIVDGTLVNRFSLADDEVVVIKAHPSQ